MLFPYVFSPQTMDKMQEFIEYMSGAPQRPIDLFN